MSWPLSILVALLTAALATVASGLVMIACVGWYRISGFEGKSGYAVGAAAILGGVAGLIIGLLTSRMIALPGGEGFLKGLGISCAIVLVVAGTTAWIARKLADVPPTIDGQELMLEVELMLPVDVKTKPGGSGETYLEFGSVVNHVQRASRRGELRTPEARLEGGRWIVPGSVALFTERGMRTLGFQIDGAPVLGFMVPLPARPTHADEAWSEWGPRPPAPNPPWPDSKPSYRFRVQRIEPPPPGPTQEEVDAAEAAQEQATFAAIAPDAPITVWLPYTRYGADEARLAAAVARIAARPAYVSELAALMVAEDAELASDALRVVEHLPQPPAALVAPVAEAGKRLAERMRRVNETTPEQDPSYLWAADVSVRFSAWMEAVRALREKCGADLTPELGQILVLSRMRSDSRVMRGDVRRVASYYMHEWAGLAPLPDDPPPR
jgi:hypothetical protein